MLNARIAFAACLFLLPLPLHAAALQGPGAGSSSQDASKGQNTEQDADAAEKAAREAAKRAENSKKLERRRAAIRERIQRERARLRQTSVVRTHVKVRVKLRNGERMTGVVKNGNFVERPTGGLEFVRAEMTQKGAGLRLWYYNNTDGYMFLPYKWIATYKVLKRLTDVEINVIREEIVEAEQKAKSASAKRLAALKDKSAALKAGTGAAGKLDALAAKIKKDKAEADANHKVMALVTEFPPSEGWGEERINQINIRRLTVKVFPNAKERRFIEVFDEWKKGRDLWVAKQSRKGKSAEKGAEQAAEKASGKTEVTKPTPGK